MIRVEEIESGREAFESARLGDDHFRLDSGGEGRWNRWSYRAGPPSLMLVGNYETALYGLRSIEASLNHQTLDGPPFKGGWLGFLSYDLGRCFEKLPSIASNDLHWPLFVFTWHEQILAHDATSGRNYLCTAKAPALTTSQWKSSGRPESSASRIDFRGAVAKALDYIAAGDIFQVNLAQRFELPMRRPAADVYRDLRTKYPASFGALLDYGGYQLISNSPELFLRVDAHRKIITRPIKGTRPRREGMEKELRESKKDQAELNMIVDLERNDLGRICEIGSVKVTNPREIEAHPTVYHGVATIEGQLRKNICSSTQPYHYRKLF